MPPDVTTRPVIAVDLSAIEALHDRAFGPGRYARTAYRIRDGLPPFSPLCRVAYQDGKLAAALRMAPITIGGVSGAQLLGPLAVEPALKGQGIGKRLAAEALDAAREAGVRLVVLVGDLPYYARFGFTVVPPGRLELPGPVDLRRLLWVGLAEGAVGEGFAGVVRGEC
jgi:predicted N-acetyltransferase YhbS